MKPESSGYQITEQSGKYYVEHKYDLMTGSRKWHRINLAFDTESDAGSHLEKVFQNHLKSYERLRKLGRGFPDND